ncbi:MAG TPA: ABC transporter substrate-binding protein [Anaeromyxobacter sp.]|nr:ABC transporter substrate-binding protein [Anaeromyxobacter sp.]
MNRTRIAAAALALAASFQAGAQGKEPLKVGALLSVTGPAAFLGAPEARTLEMLVEELNAKGGVDGRKIELIVKDTGGNPEKAISFAKQLIEENGVFAIIGPATSGESIAVKQFVNDASTILLSCAAAEVITTPVLPYVFKVAPKDSYAAEMIFRQMKKLGVKRIGVLSSNTGFGKAGKEQVEKLAPAHGIEIAASEVYDKAATDLTAEVTKLKAANVQAILNWSIEPAQSIVIKNARQIGLAVPIFQSHGFANVQYAKAAGAAAEGVMFPASRIVVAESLAASDKQKPVVASYKKGYEARFKEDVSTFGGHAYDALGILVRAVKEAGLDREKARKAIEDMKGFVGTAGVFNFSPEDHNGLSIEAFEMITVKGGKFVVLGR